MKQLTPLARDCIEAARLALIAARAEMLQSDEFRGVTEDELRRITSEDVNRLLGYANAIISGEAPPLHALNAELREQLEDFDRQSADTLNGVLLQMAAVASEIRAILRSSHSN